MPLYKYRYNDMEVMATRRRPSTRDDKKYMREVEMDGRQYLVHYGDPDMDMQRDIPERRANFLSRHNCSEKGDPLSPGFWACYDWANTDEKSIDGDYHERMIADGDAVKALDGNGRIGFYGVLFHTTDLQGERFTPQTDFGIQQRIPLIYQHGQDATLKARVLGIAEVMRRDDVGLWMEAQLELRDDYERSILSLIEAGKLGVSTGALSHTVNREGGLIKTWWLGEVSLTPTPAEPKTKVVALKQDSVIDLDQDDPEANLEAHDARVAVVNDSITVVNEDHHMTEIDNTPRLDSLEETVKTIGAGLDKILTLLANEPKVANSGTLIADGVTGTDRNIKSLTDFFLAVKNGNTQRLTKVYGAMKDMSDLTGASGGYLIPEEFNTSLMQGISLASEFLPLVRVQNVTTSSGRYPMPDVTVTPTANVGQTASAAGTVSTAKPSGSAFTETTPALKMLNFTIHTIGGFVDVTKELTQDSAFSIDQMFNNLAGESIRAKQEYGVIRGSGVGEYLGFLNADAGLAIDADTDNTFDYQDAAEIYSRFFMMNNATTRWVVNNTAMQDILNMEISTGSGSALGTVSLNGRTYMTLFGIPVITSQHMSATDSSGDIALVDFSAYIRFVRSGFSVFYTPHQKATEGLDVFVFNIREDGKPMFPNKITLADGTTTVSPFVYNND